MKYILTLATLILFCGVASAQDVFKVDPQTVFYTSDFCRKPSTVFRNSDGGNVINPAISARLAYECGKLPPPGPIPATTGADCAARRQQALEKWCMEAGYDCARHWHKFGPDSFMPADCKVPQSKFITDLLSRTLKQ
jgi:hypothetical protein